MKNNFLRVSIALLVLTATPMFLTSCKAQERKEHSEQSEGKGHDEDGEKRSEQSEGKGHDKDGEEHSEQSEGKGHDEDGEKHSEQSEGKGHDEDGKEHSERGGESEESGTEYDLSYKYNVTKYGVKLTLAYDKSSNSFKGTVKNISEKLADKVRVEIHLSNGTELGPTTPIDLKPNESKQVVLKATESNFTGWSAHAEVGRREHEGSEGGEGHGSEESGEHR